MAWNPNLSYGNAADDFGGADYTEALIEVQSQGQQALVQRRKDILEWLRTKDAQAQVWKDNKWVEGGGKSSGLSERISSGAIGVEHGRNPGHVSGDPTQSQWFGHADYLAASAAGHSDKDIFDWIDQRQDKLRDANKKGGGGIYDTLASRVGAAEKEKSYTDAISGLKDSMTGWAGDITKSVGTQITGLESGMAKGLGSVADAIKAQSAEQAQYRADQADWRRKQEQMQLQQMHEARRKAKEKPVMQVLPGQTSYGGGGGGAGSFARKKRQTTGLNIA